MTPHEFRAIRLELGLSQVKFGLTLSGLPPAVKPPSYQRVSDWERGHEKLPVHWVMRANQLKRGS